MQVNKIESNITQLEVKEVFTITLKEKTPIFLNTTLSTFDI